MQSESERLRLAFQQLCAQRDAEASSQTEVRGYDTSDGYVQEVVSTSPRVSRTSSNEEFQTRTVRRSTTKGSGPLLQTAPSLKIGAIQVTSPRETPQSSNWDDTTSVASSSAAVGSVSVASSLRPLPPHSPPVNATWDAAQVLPSAPRSHSIVSQESSVGSSTTRRIAGVSPAGPRARWVREEIQVHNPIPDADARGGFVEEPQRRNVSYGDVHTQVIEPSRVSPLHGIGVYAPVKYISKRELRRRRLQQLGGSAGALESRIRSGSVPRLDRERAHLGRQFAPFGVNDDRFEPTHDPQRASPQQYASHGDPTKEQGYFPMSDHRGNFGAFHNCDHLEEQYHPPQRRVGRPREQRALHSERYSTPQRLNGSPPQPAMVRPWVFSPDPQVRAQPRVTTRETLPETSITLADVSAHLAHARGAIAMPPPSYGEAAFRLLARGTYLVKYGQGGNPHERWLTIRLVSDEETGYSGPYLLWAIHDESVSFKEKLHLSHLIDVRRGANSAKFTRQMVSADKITGPLVGGERSYLPVDLAFSLVFRSSTAMRSVDVLALDEQTYSCWLLVCEYLASINNQDIGVAPVGAESLAPDTPRSMSQGSQR